MVAVKPLNKRNGEVSYTNHPSPHGTNYRFITMNATTTAMIGKASTNATPMNIVV